MVVVRSNDSIESEGSQGTRRVIGPHERWIELDRCRRHVVNDTLVITQRNIVCLSDLEEAGYEGV